MKKLISLTSIGLLTMVVGIQVFAQEGEPAATQEPAQAAKVAETSEDKDEDSSEAVDDKSKASFWMEHKLRLSTEILAGLAESDFEKIRKNATVMRGINRVEGFVRREPKGYKDQLKLFNMANRAIIRAANEENLEAATLAFNRLTVSCVSCHQHLRRDEE